MLFLLILSLLSISHGYNAISKARMTTNLENSPSDHDLLVRALIGEKTERAPVWLMRQAGRYMAAFREYSEKYPFRMRSETPEIAIELSLQPWKAFGVDGVIMFSDILTPLPAMGPTVISSFVMINTFRRDGVLNATY